MYAPQCYGAIFVSKCGSPLRRTHFSISHYCAIATDVLHRNQKTTKTKRATNGTVLQRCGATTGGSSSSALFRKLYRSCISACEVSSSKVHVLFPPVKRTTKSHVQRGRNALCCQGYQHMICTRSAYFTCSTYSGNNYPMRPRACFTCTLLQPWQMPHCLPSVASGRWTVYSVCHYQPC